MRTTGGLAAMHFTKGFLRPRSFSGSLLLAALLVTPYSGGVSQQQNPGMGTGMGTGASNRFPGTPRDMPQDPSQASPFSEQYNNPWEAEKRLRMINAERQKSMVSDTDKLLKLATELNSEIAKSSSGELSPAQLRKVADIEKLAHNVRDKMVMSVRGPQFNMDNTPPYFPPPTR